MNDHLSHVEMRNTANHQYLDKEALLEAAREHYGRLGVDVPTDPDVEWAFIDTLHYAVQAICNNCGMHWQNVFMNAMSSGYTVRSPCRCGSYRWHVFPFTHSPPPFESGIPGRNVPPALQELNVADYADQERDRLNKRRRGLLKRFPNAFSPREAEDAKQSEQAAKAEEALLGILGSMAKVPLSQMPFELRQIVRKLRGDDEDDTGKGAYGRTVDDDDGGS